MEQVEKVLYDATAHTNGILDGASSSSQGRPGVELSSPGGAGNSTLAQRLAIGFAAGVVGGLAVVLFGFVLFQSGITSALGVDFPVRLKSPEIYRPLFWAGLWGIPFGLLVKTVWNRLYLVGFLYFLAPVLALFTIFLPLGGAGFFGLQHGGPMFTAYLVLVNLPFGITTAVVARAIIGKKP